LQSNPYDLTSAVLNKLERLRRFRVESRTRQNYKQQDLIITHESESEITVDNTDVARFIGLLLSNEKIRDVDTIGKEGGADPRSLHRGA
jgi:hypothetical protein